MCDCRVRLIASVPGAHTGRHMHKWGHLKLRKVALLLMVRNGTSRCCVTLIQVLSEHTVEGNVDPHWPVVGQFSSIGSLGPTNDNWLCSEWLQSLSSVKKSTKTYTAQSNAALQLVCHIS